MFSSFDLGLLGERYILNYDKIVTNIFICAVHIIYLFHKCLIFFVFWIDFDSATLWGKLIQIPDIHTKNWYSCSIICFIQISWMHGSKIAYSGQIWLTITEEEENGDESDKHI